MISGHLFFMGLESSFCPIQGLFSSIMRDMANMANDSPKWIVLDGDIDPMWIESLNTVMDDNKVGTVFGLTKKCGEIKNHKLGEDRVTCTCSYLIVP